VSSELLVSLVRVRCHGIRAAQLPVPNAKKELVDHSAAHRLQKRHAGLRTSEILTFGRFWLGYSGETARNPRNIMQMSESSPQIYGVQIYLRQEFGHRVE